MTNASDKVRSAAHTKQPSLSKDFRAEAKRRRDSFLNAFLIAAADLHEKGDDQVPLPKHWELMPARDGKSLYLSFYEMSGSKKVQLKTYTGPEFLARCYLLSLRKANHDREAMIVMANREILFSY